MANALLMRVTGALTIFLAACALASAASLTFSDGECQYRVAYDARKVDRARLKATFDYLASPSPLELGPTLVTQGDIAKIDLPAYRASCADHRKRLAAPLFVTLPGAEDLRKREIDELDAHCRQVEATMAAAKGELAPMRAQAPACSRYADLLAVPAADLKTRWNDLVVDLCRTSIEPNVCAGYQQRQGEGPGSETRRRLAVLTRWGECASAKVPAGHGMDDIDTEKRRLRDSLAKRFKVKTLSCAQ